MISDESYSESLPKGLQASYTSRKRELVKRIENEFKKNIDFYKNLKKDGIQSDKRHRDLINMCVFPFTDTGALAKSNYKYIRAAPLSEFGVGNFDFVLFKDNEREKVAIIGECKGSVSDPAGIVAESISRRKIVEEKLDIIKEKYLKLDRNSDLRVEYVIAVPSTHAVDMLNSVIKNKAKFIVWHAPLTGIPEISLAWPHKNDENPIKDMIHGDSELNKQLLAHAPSNRRTFNYFPQGHIFSKLQSLLLAIKIEGNGKIILKEELKRNLQQDLFYAEDTIDDAIGVLLSKGVEIGFLEFDCAGSVYRIRGKGYRADILERVLEDKWIGKQLSAELETNKEKEIEKLRAEVDEEARKMEEKIDAEIRKTRKISDYFPKDDGRKGEDV